MSVIASRSIQIAFSGDVQLGPQNFSAADNSTSYGQEDLVTLSSGNNTITPPSVTGITFVALTIIPPSANANLITLKGVNGDTGIPLHKTDPTSIGLDSSFTTLVLNAAAQINGVRLIWS